MWRVSYNQPDGVQTFIPKHLELVPRISICAVLGIGLAYGIRVVFEFRRYGRDMEKKWKERFRAYVEEASKTIPPPFSNPPPIPGRRISRLDSDGAQIQRWMQLQEFQDELQNAPMITARDISQIPSDANLVYQEAAVEPRHRILGPVAALSDSVLPERNNERVGEDNEAAAG